VVEFSESVGGDASCPTCGRPLTVSFARDHSAAAAAGPGGGGGGGGVAVRKRGILSRILRDKFQSSTKASAVAWPLLAGGARRAGAAAGGEWGRLGLFCGLVARRRRRQLAAKALHADLKPITVRDANRAPRAARRGAPRAASRKARPPRRRPRAAHTAQIEALRCELDRMAEADPSAKVGAPAPPRVPMNTPGPRSLSPPPCAAFFKQPRTNEPPCVPCCGGLTYRMAFAYYTALPPAPQAIVFSQFTSFLDLIHFRLEQVCFCRLVTRITIYS
jgi:hypothetical protein